ncbi:MAG: hypothetical protein EXX96DRAFT_543013 [Benjaminiella poitrasii]|nr:MAG: hypothetical protein EXX96DRAFT_543013 [Benjaminiella poitrasii]
MKSIIEKKTVKKEKQLLKQRLASEASQNVPKKYKEKDKQSERYKLLKLIWIVQVKYILILRVPKATENLFSSNFGLLLTIIFQSDNISIESSETVSEVTSHAAAAANSGSTVCDANVIESRLA